MSDSVNAIDGAIQAQIRADQCASGHDPDEDSFITAVNRFVAASDWLDDEHAPSLVTLKQLARQLDQRVTGALVAQFGVTFRDLRAQAPASNIPVTPPTDEPAVPADPLEAALLAAGK